MVWLPQSEFPFSFLWKRQQCRAPSQFKIVACCTGGNWPFPNSLFPLPEIMLVYIELAAPAWELPGDLKVMSREGRVWGGEWSQWRYNVIWRSVVILEEFQASPGVGGNPSNSAFWVKRTGRLQAESLIRTMCFKINLLGNFFKVIFFTSISLVEKNL